MNPLGLKSSRFNKLTYFLSIFAALFLFGIPIALSTYIPNKNGVVGSSPNLYIFIIFAIGYYGYVIAAIIKRLHDLNINGLWVIAFAIALFIPFINFISGFYILLADGTKGENRYGNRPETIDVLGFTLWKKSNKNGC